MATRTEIDAAAEEARRAALRDAIVAALKAHGGNRTAAAKALGYATGSALVRGAARVGLDVATVAPPLSRQECGAIRSGDARDKRVEKAAKRAARGKR
jgi:hypothetical protein